MYKVISTFSGIGGSSTGYKMAGFNVVGSVEFLDYQAKTYKANYPNTRLYQDDIRKLNPLQILKDLNIEVGELDILDGSPPCSSFSTSGKGSDGWGKSKSYGNRNQRTDDLFFEYIRFIKEIKPKVFVAENVKGLITGDAKGYFNIIIKGMSALGYKVKAKLLCAKYYGVPQSRQRVIFIGVRDDLNIEPSYPIALNKFVTLSKAFAGLENSEFDINEANIEKYAVYQKLKTLNHGESHIKLFNLVKNNPNLPSFTLTATSGSSCASICHWDNRKHTIPELKRICSFPDDYKLIGDFNTKSEGLGRAVPPLMMKAIAENIKLNILDKIKK